jgi:AraC-like DNA-binding protein
MTRLVYSGTGDLRLSEAAEWTGLQETGLRPHFHEEIQVSIVMEGFRDYVIAGHSVRVFPGSLLALAAGVPHHALASTRRGVRSLELYIPSDVVAPSIRGALDSRLATIIDGPCFSGDVEQAMADAVLFLESPLQWRDIAGSRNGGQLEQLRRQSELLTRCVNERLSISELASEMRMARETFSRFFRNTFGMNARDAVVNLRLNKSRFLLRHDAKPGEAAYEAGFSDQSHLGRHFAEYFGTTPGCFRAAHRPR